MTDTWTDLVHEAKRRGSDTPLVTLGTRGTAYLNAAARRLLGRPRRIRWQAVNGAVSLAGDDSTGYIISKSGYVTCTPLLDTYNGTLPATFQLAPGDEPGRLLFTARIPATLTAPTTTITEATP